MPDALDCPEYLKVRHHLIDYDDWEHFVETRSDNPNIWIDKHGGKHFIPEMSRTYLQNTLALIERKAEQQAGNKKFCKHVPQYENIKWELELRNKTGNGN